MQLSIMSEAVVKLSVYNPEDSSLLEYTTNEISDKKDIKGNDVHEYVRLTNDDYNLIEKLDQRVSK